MEFSSPGELEMIIHSGWMGPAVLDKECGLSDGAELGCSASPYCALQNSVAMQVGVRRR